jgi:membrane fusion protein (multidrug efflux system)
MTLQRNFKIVGGCVLLGAAIIAFLALNRDESAARTQSTDDAYVQADLTVLSPQVAGVVARLDVAENQSVRAGTPLLQIDDRDLRVAVDGARAGVAAAQAGLASLQAQIARQDSARGQARAALAADDANIVLATANAGRYARLARDEAGTLQAQQQAEAQLGVQRAGRERDVAGLSSVAQQTGVLRAELGRAQAELQRARATLAAAELNLSHARLLAPVAGVVTQRVAHVGAYVSPGKPVLTLVPLDAIYIDANFRETQLARVRVGLPVSITVDALPGVHLLGHVASLAPASGASLSAVAPHNATGNFTKIVQRLPVRISLDPGQAALAALRVGMSVRTEVTVPAAT